MLPLMKLYTRDRIGRLLKSLLVKQWCATYSDDCRLRRVGTKLIAESIVLCLDQTKRN